MTDKCKTDPFDTLPRHSLFKESPHAKKPVDARAVLMAAEKAAAPLGAKKPRGRPLSGETPMTPAQRKAAERARKKEGLMV